MFIATNDKCLVFHFLKENNHFPRGGSIPESLGTIRNLAAFSKLCSKINVWRLGLLLKDCSQTEVQIIRFM